VGSSPPPPWQQALRELADHGIGRVEHVAEVVLHRLAHQDVRPERVEAVALLQPAEHLAGGVLDALVERPRVADGEDVLGVLAARPPDPLSLAQPHGEADVHRDLDPRPGDLAVPLERVAVPEVQQRPLHEHRKVDRDPRHEAAIVHVAAVLGRGGGGDRLAAGRGHPEAAEHRREGQGERPQARLRLHQRRGAGVRVDVPLGAPALVAGRPGQLGGVGRVYHVRGHHRAAEAVAAVRPDPLELDHERVARLGPLDVERAGHRVAAGRHPLAAVVEAGGIDRGGLDRVAVGYPQHRRMRAEGAVVVRRRELVDGHWRSLRATDTTVCRTVS
jgi:hypothetical protein